MIGVAGPVSVLDASELSAAFPAATFIARASGPWDMLPIEHCYDELFESGDLAGLPGAIAQDLLARSVTNDIVYVVPGRGDAGDLTVASLAAITDVEFYPKYRPLLPTGQLQVVDALALAIAEQQHPFDAGQAPIDPAVPLHLCNWTGRRVTELATKRLRRVYGPEVDLRAGAHDEVWINALPAYSASSSVSGLSLISAYLRSPDGCPWDREQTIASMTKSVAEEVGELAEAVAAGDVNGQVDELGDILMNLMLITQIAHERGSYSLEDVVTNVAAKMIRRHPHVFGDLEVNSVDEVLNIWQKVKAGEGQVGRSSGEGINR